MRCCGSRSATTGGSCISTTLATGKLKNQITHGEGDVTQVLHVDEKARVIYFLAVGKEAGRDPYFACALSRELRWDGA